MIDPKFFDIWPEARITRITYGKGLQVETADAEDRDDSGLYFTPAKIRDGFRGPKPKESDIESTSWIFVDVDPPKSIKDIDGWKSDWAIPNSCPVPTVIVDSGNGYQLFWRLREPETRFDAVKATNKRMAEKLTGDHCHNIDRLARVPGTMNFPDERKRRLGRVPRLSSIVSYRPELVYTLDSFLPGIEDTIEDLPISEACKTVILTGSSDENEFDDRSSAVWFVVNECLRRGVDRDLIKHILLDPSLPISGHCRDQKRSGAYADRQIDKGIEELKAEEQSRSDPAAYPDAYITDEQGRPLHRPENVLAHIRSRSESLRLNRFTGQAEVHRPTGYVQIDDMHVRDVWLGLQYDAMKPAPSDAWVRNVLIGTAERAPYHPVRDLFESLAWDGVERLDTWLIDYAHAPDTLYVREASRVWMIAAVRRILQPGCKFDSALVLCAPQGHRKSTLARAAAIRDEWFAAIKIEPEAKKVIEQVSGKWIVELEEMDGMRRAGVEAVKALLSAQEDRARLAYARTTTAHPRQFVFIGTSNDLSLKDHTGNRRFWPIPVRDIDVEGYRQARLQILAEAICKEKTYGYLDLSPQAGAELVSMQEGYREEDPWLDIVARAVADSYGVIATGEIFDLIGVEAERQTPRDASRIRAIMEQLGFRRAIFRRDGRRARGYRRGNIDAPIEIESVM